MTEQKGWFVGTMTDFRKRYVGYTVLVWFNENWTPMLRGSAKWSHLTLLADLFNNVEMMGKITKDMPLQIQLNETFHTHDQAQEWVARNPLNANRSERVRARGRPTFRIRCETNDEEYDSQAEACRANNIASSAMSNHLNHPTRHRSVNGLVFQRI